MRFALAAMSDAHGWKSGTALTTRLRSCQDALASRDGSAAGAPPCRWGHFVPGAAVELAATGLRGQAAPLLEEERDAGALARVAEVADPHRAVLARPAGRRD